MLLADIKNGQKHDSNLWANFGNNQQETISKQSVKKIYLINTYLISETLTIKIDLQNYCCPSKQSYIDSATFKIIREKRKKNKKIRLWSLFQKDAHT